MAGSAWWWKCTHSFPVTQKSQALSWTQEERKRGSQETSIGGLSQLYARQPKRGTIQTSTAGELTFLHPFQGCHLPIRSDGLLVRPRTDNAQGQCTGRSPPTAHTAQGPWLQHRHGKHRTRSMRARKRSVWSGCDTAAPGASSGFSGCDTASPGPGSGTIHLLLTPPAMPLETAFYCIQIM